MGIEHASPLMALFLSLTIVTTFFLNRQQKDFRGLIRKLPALSHIDKVIALSAEKGKPVMISTGMTGVGTVLYACLTFIRYISQKSAQYSLDLFCPQNSPESIVMVEDALREGAIEAGRPEYFGTRNVPFLSEDQFAYASGYIGMLHREKPGATFLLGTFAAEALILSQAGKEVGAKQIGASVSPEQVPFFVCTTEYTLIGEELFAAAALIQPEKSAINDLLLQDWIKVFFVVLILGGVFWISVRGFIG